jgi:hypothetical protein
MTDRQTKITFAEMREKGVRGVLIYCADYTCSHSIAVNADEWPDDMRLSDIEQTDLPEPHERKLRRLPAHRCAAQRPLARDRVPRPLAVTFANGARRRSRAENGIAYRTGNPCAPDLPSAHLPPQARS